MLISTSVIAVAIFLGVFTQRVIGFGMPMFVVPALLLFFEPPKALIITLYIGLVTSIIIFQNLRKKTEFPKNILLAILPISVAGIALGSYIITVIDKSLLQIILGILIIASMNIQEYFLPKPTKKMIENKKIYIVGLSAGFFNSTVALSAAPLIIWLRSFIIQPNQVRQIMASTFIFMNILSILLIFTFKPDLLSQFDLFIFAAVLPLIFLGNLIGKIAANRISAKAYEKIVYIALTTMGIMSLVAGTIDTL